MRERYVRHLDRLIELAGREVERNREDEQRRGLAEFYHANFSHCRDRFLKWNGDLLGVFRRLQQEGCLEIVASAATHGLLPLLHQSPEAVRAQILIGCDAYRAAFGSDPSGFWLPECAYTPGLENILREANLRWFIIDAHGLMFADPRPRRAIYAPCYTRRGRPLSRATAIPAGRSGARPRGIQAIPPTGNFTGTSALSFRRNTSARGHGAASQKFTGIKYHRITNRDGGEKELYDPAMAAPRRGSACVSFSRSAAAENE